MERWKLVDWIDGYRGVLEVSDQGRARRTSYRYQTTGRWGSLHTTTKPDKILAPYVEKNGYPTIAVQISGKRRKFSLHILVARAFSPGYAPDLCVNHINGIKTDNRADNLEWVTRSRNSQHAWEHSLVDLRGDQNPQRKLSSGKVRILRDLIRLGATPNQLAVLCDVDTSLIYKIRDGKRWSSV